MQLSVIIVSYNVCDFLIQCLDSVLRACKELEAEVWVVDNASTDHSVRRAQRLFPNVHFIQNHDNVGFARANNQAIRKSTGQYVLLLNPDTIVGEATLKGCIDFLESHPSAGATGTQMLNRDGSFALESRRGLPTPATSFYKVTGLCSLFPQHRRFGKYYMRYLDKDQPAEIEVISGAFIMLRRTALEQAGLLDEDYFMYGEDIDLSYCMLQAGWQNWYQPLPILHYKGESTQKTSFRYVHSFYNAMLIFFDKHFAHRYRTAALVIRLAVVLRALVEMLWQWLRRTHEFIGLNRHTQHRPERLLFIGTDEGWKVVQELALKGRMEAIRSIHSLADGGHLNYTDTENDYLYAVYQTDAPGTTYAAILDLMSRGCGHKPRTLLGTFAMRTRTIILPNDILR